MAQSHSAGSRIRNMSDSTIVSASQTPTHCSGSGEDASQMMSRESHLNELVHDGNAPGDATSPKLQATVEDGDEDNVDILENPATHKEETTDIEAAPDFVFKAAPGTRESHHDPVVVNTSSVSPTMTLHEPFPHNPQQEALKYLDADSPGITHEAIRRSMDGRNSFGMTSMAGIPYSPTHGSCLGNMPPHSGWLDERYLSRSSVSPRHEAATLSAGSPRMSSSDVHYRHTGNTTNSWASPSSPSFPGAVPFSQTQHIPQSTVKSPNQNQKTLRTGYDYMALSLTGRPFNTHLAPVTPIYRRFEALSHRILLQLQDEIVELEQQLQNIDAADTRVRMGPEGMIPASRRGGSMLQGELAWQKDEILGKIGWKLSRYNEVLASFRGAQKLAIPSLGEIQEYRNFLRAGGAIAEPETHFLDDPNDLVSLAWPTWPESIGEATSPAAGTRETTPAPPLDTMDDVSSKIKGERSKSRRIIVKPSIICPACIGNMAILIPIVLFPVIETLAQRMMLSAMMFVATVAMAWETGLLLDHMGKLRKILIAFVAGLYGVLMFGVARAI